MKVSGGVGAAPPFLGPLRRQLVTVYLPFMSDYQTSPAANIRAARERLKITQEQVAEHLGIPRSAVSEMEAGKRDISASELFALARLFGESGSSS